MNPNQEYLQETYFLDFNHPDFDLFLQDFPTDITPKQTAIALYFKVRDGFIYDPYRLDLRKEGLKASALLQKSRGWCVEKSTLLAALARRFDIPSRIGYAIVTNHIGVERLTDILKSKEIVFHGYVELFLEGKWVKCTPAFDQKICMMANVEPLDWDGETDSLFQEFSGGQQFMEYLHFYGDFADVPNELMHAEMKKHYPHLFEQQHTGRNFYFRFDE